MVVTATAGGGTSPLTRGRGLKLSDGGQFTIAVESPLTRGRGLKPNVGPF